MSQVPFGLVVIVCVLALVAIGIGVKTEQERRALVRKHKDTADLARNSGAALDATAAELRRHEEALAELTRRAQALHTEAEELRRKRQELERRAGGLDNQVRAQAEEILLLNASREELLKMSDVLRERFAALEQRNQELVLTEGHLAEARGELRKLQSQTEAQRQRMEESEAEMDELRRTSVSVEREAYRMVVVGMRGTGKTQIVYHWANPLWKPEPLEGTTFSVYKKTVSTVASSQASGDRRVLVDHVFEILDYGGERLGAAFAAMVKQKIHGLLIVVDLGRDERAGLEEGRIEEQLRQFDENLLQAFLGSPEVMNFCSTVVLFINKSDLLTGRPAEVETQARAIYEPLIARLIRQQKQTPFDLEIMVGSGWSGHNTHLLMPHFIRAVLPPDAYDDGLMQKPNQREIGAR